MIVCPNCSHINPEGALNCEACYTALPATKACPACGASVQLDATFCGQCGQILKPEENQSSPLESPTTPPNPLPEPLGNVSGLPPTVLSASQSVPTPISATEQEIEPLVAESSPPDLPVTVLPSNEVAPPVTPGATATLKERQLQQSARNLLHLQTNTLLEIPPHLPVVYVGKPNDKFPPDIDVSGFPCSEVVSRIHSSIRLDGENYYIEDIGSANGTYINHNALAKGNRHLLRSGDRISLGKGDLVTFIFQ
jgi:pSer/pThr/pTyr-binding forkhead associated (FHA) protein